MKKTCKCDFCKLYTRFQKVVKDRSLKEKNSLINDLFDKWVYTSEDLNYKAAILDGSWPSAVEQLKRALANAEKIAAERKAEEDKEFRGNF